MSAVSTTAVRPHAGFARFAALVASRPLGPALAIAAILTALRLSGTVDSDVAWQLWIAGRIHAGAHLYRDIIEVNPPLWFWMALPIDSTARLFHVRAESVLAVAMGALVMLALCATEPLLRYLAAPRRALLLGYAAVVLVGLPWVHLGQREQIVLIGAVPYAALIAARRDGRSVPPLLAFVIGAAAAIGFALKHYFLMVPAALELWLVAGQVRDWRLRRPEILALIAVGALYAAAVLLWSGEFLTKMVALVHLSYGQLGAPGLHLFGRFAAVGLVSLCATAVALRRSKKTARLTSTLLVAGAAFAAAYFIQAKGWVYHAMPLLGCGSLALAALLVESSAPMRLLRLTAPALLALPLFLTAEEQLHPVLPGADLEEAVAGLQPGDTTGFLTIETAVPWSITLQRKLRYPSRYMGYWMLGAIVANEHRDNSDPRLVALGRQIVSDTVQDFTCTPPKRIIVQRPRPGEDAFDILPFFLRDPAFAALLAHYEVRSRTSLETYELTSPLPAPTLPCRTGV